MATQITLRQKPDPSEFKDYQHMTALTAEQEGAVKVLQEQANIFLEYISIPMSKRPFDGGQLVYDYFRTAVAALWLSVIKLGLVYDEIYQEVKHYISVTHGIKPKLELSYQDLYRAVWDLYILLNAYDHAIWNDPIENRRSKLYDHDVFWNAKPGDGYPG
ncbi:hypothetical protein FACS1894217_05600 [Clostridia bacterium]|nr:hypothetical protein FACS1894217_05600 [Clostridia bacterium]